MTTRYLFLPEMTSLNTPSPFVASASSTWFQGSQAWNPFSARLAGGSHYWASSPGVLTGWLKIDLGSPLKIIAYGIQEAGSLFSPKDFTLQGSSDDSTWTTIDTRTGITFPSGTGTKWFNLSAEQTFRYYKLDVTAINGSTENVRVGSLLFVIPTPSGGGGPLIGPGGLVY